MIYLKKGQTIFDNPSMVVYDPTGYYDDGTSVICAPVFAPEEPACRYEAKYIAYGGIVYTVSDEEELLKQIQEIDPTTLFGKDSKQVAVDKITDQIVAQDTSIQTEEPVDKENIKDVETAPIANNTSTTTSPTTTSPADILPPVDTATTTNPVIEPVADIATTTPPTTTSPADILPPVDTATTTPSIVEVLNTSTTTAPTITPPADILPPVDTATTTLTQ